MIRWNGREPDMPSAGRLLSSEQDAQVLKQYAMWNAVSMCYPQSGMDVSKQPKSLVGFAGIRNSIEVRHNQDGIVCRISTGSYIFVLVGTGIFGPGLGYLFYFHPEKLQPHTPGVILAVVWFLIILSSLIFLRYALGRPRFEAASSTGEIRYFAWRTSSPSLVLRWSDIKSMEVEERIFLNEGTRVPNYCVTVATHQDRRYALCISTNKQLISSLKNDLENARIGRV
jgi:hypothetical protein